MPVEWAQTMNNLATAYRNRIRGDRAENIEQAIEAYQQSLTVRTQSAMPVKWATTMMNHDERIRAIAQRIYRRLRHTASEAIAMPASENIDRKRLRRSRYQQQCLTVSTQTAMPIEWAQTMMNLATAYSNRIRGDRAENIEQAIAAYQQSLTVRTQTAMPVEWAHHHDEPGDRLLQRIRGDRAENIEQAIVAYQQCLTVMTQSALPVDGQTSHESTWAAYSNRIRGDRAENIELAIAAYRQSLTVTTQSAMPVDWAQTMMNLATAYYSTASEAIAQRISSKRLHTSRA